MPDLIVIDYSSFVHNLLDPSVYFVLVFIAFKSCCLYEYSLPQYATVKMILVSIHYNIALLEYSYFQV